eukprot:633607-Prorocentrum_minimum.AAC.1
MDAARRRSPAPSWWVNSNPSLYINLWTRSGGRRHPPGGLTATRPLTSTYGRGQAAVAGTLLDAGVRALEGAEISWTTPPALPGRPPPLESQVGEPRRHQPAAVEASATDWSDDQRLAVSLACVHLHVLQPTERHPAGERLLFLVSHHLIISMFSYLQRDMTVSEEDCKRAACQYSADPPNIADLATKE